MKQQCKSELARLKLHNCKYPMPPVSRDFCFNHTAWLRLNLNSSSPLQSQISASVLFPHSHRLLSCLNAELTRVSSTQEPGHIPPQAGFVLLTDLRLTLHHWSHPASGKTVKSRSTPVGGPVKSGQRWMREEGRGLDKRLVWLELVTTWIQRLRTMSVDPLHRFQWRGDRDRDK